MEISIYCHECKAKTPHKPIIINNNSDGEIYTQWLCMDCQNGYHRGKLEFTSNEQGTITKDNRTKNHLKTIKTKEYEK